jgi:hypothetical protein
MNNNNLDFLASFLAYAKPVEVWGQDEDYAVFEFITAEYTWTVIARCDGWQEDRYDGYSQIPTWNILEFHPTTVSNLDKIIEEWKIQSKFEDDNQREVKNERQAHLRIVD